MSLPARCRRLGQPAALEDQLRRRIQGERARGMTLRVIADQLTAASLTGHGGKRWHPSTVRYAVEGR
jgi:hypothetical protein